VSNSEKARKIGKWTAIGAMVFLPVALWLVFFVWTAPPQLVTSLDERQKKSLAKTKIPEAPFAKRHRHVAIDPGVLETLEKSSGSLRIELFPGETVTIDFGRADHEAEDFTSVMGVVRGQPESQVSLVSHKGTFGGSINLADGRSFVINYAGPGSYSVVELDHDKMNVDHHLHDHYAAALPSPDEIPENGVVSMPQLPWNQVVPVPGMPWFTTTLIGTNPWPQPVTNVYGPPVIGTMILYTPQAANQLAGLLGVETRIRLAVSQINACFLKSGTAARIRLVHSGIINYSSTGNLTTDLQQMTYNTSPQTQDIHSLRVQHRADLVTLMVPASGNNILHGTSWLLTSFFPAPDFGFNAIEAPYINTSVLAHEIGHNLGCNHATNDIGANLGGAFTNSFAWRFNTVSGGFTNPIRTLMAYGTGRRIGYFSNPGVQFWGVPTGDTNWANNAYTIERTAPMVGTYMSGGYGPPYYYNPATAGGTQANSRSSAPSTVIRASVPPPPFNRPLLRQPARNFLFNVRN
tara:strand:+ start:33890 stop:35446 length:1557 start_codon:yes stop_codon:yes gene_type:complete